MEPSAHKNLSAFAEMEKQGKMRVQVHTTVQIYNVLDLNELFEYTNTVWLFSYLRCPESCPDYLKCACVLPQNLKQVAAQTIAIWIQEEKVEGLINYMMAEDSD